MLKDKLSSLLTVRRAHAHCDVPCGIYDPAIAQNAALSVARFLDLIEELEPKLVGGDASVENLAKLARLVEQKESHAAKVKSEVVIIWGDYFKAAQIEMVPEVHGLVHEIMQKASACKQQTAVDNGRELVALVNRFAAAFWQTKDIETQTVVSSNLPKLEMVQPVLSGAE